MKEVILPRYIVEKVNGQWEVYNTEKAETYGPFDTKEQAEQTKKLLET